MNAVEIEQAITDLAEQRFDLATFPYAFLEAFGNKKTTIKRLRAGASNKSDLSGVLQTSNIHILTCDAGAVPKALKALKDSPATCAYQKPYPKLHIHEICRFVGGGGDYRKDFSELSLKFVPDIADPSRIGGACSEPECELEQRTLNCNGGAAFPDSSGDAPVLVMKTANVREGDDLSSLQLIDAARLRALLVQREMRSCGVVVSKVGT